MNKIMNKKKLLTLFVISFSAALIYQVPYLKQVFYGPLKEALGVTHVELGSLSAIYGTAAMFCFIPGGILADKFRVKNLFSLSLIVQGIMILYYATMPSFTAVKVIYFLMAITSDLTFWSARLKVVRLMSSEEEYSTNQGISSGIYGFGGIVLSFSVLFIIARAANDYAGLVGALVFYGVLHLIFGILSYILIEKYEDEIKEGSKINLNEFVEAIKLPEVWAICSSLFFLWGVYAAVQYTTPYLTTVYGASDNIVGVIGLIRSYGVSVLAAPLMGIVATKYGSVSKVVVTLSLVIIGGTIAFFLLPVGPSFILLVVALIIAIAFFINGAYGISFAQLGEAKIPIAIFGAASGLMSVIGYLPDIFIYTLIGGWLDNYTPQIAYRNVFILMIVFAIGSLLSSYTLYRLVKKKKSKETNQKQTA